MSSCMGATPSTIPLSGGFVDIVALAFFNIYVCINRTLGNFVEILETRCYFNK